MNTRRRKVRGPRRVLRRNSRNRWGLARWLILAAAVLPILGMLSTTALAAGLYYYTQNLPSPDAVIKRDVFQSTLIFDRNGELLYEIWDPQGGRRQVVPLSEIPGHLIAATLATEDANFYENPGFDLRSIFRAGLQNIQGQEILSGGSTITQQLIRNTLMDPKERFTVSYERKIKEVVLAFRLSQQYTKDQILEWYLNEINYGNLAYGVEAAAQSYFGKAAKELNLAESALIAGLPQQPARYNPLINLKAAKARQSEVLDLMVSQSYISPAEAEKAKREPLTFTTKQFDIKAPHFVMYVRELLERRFGREKLYYGGLRVQTTLDYQMYLAAERAARDHIERIRHLNANNAALVSVDPRTGEILVMLGSTDYFDSKIAGQINMALAERQPGSTLKPFTYAAGFERGLYPATVVIDQATEFPVGPGQPPYRPMNHDRKWHGPVTLRQALAQSLNIPAVLVLEHVGVKPLVDILHSLGITSLNDETRYGLPITLGGGEVKLLDLTFAYASLANGGIQVGAKVPLEERRPGLSEYEPVSILKITDNEGNVLEEYSPPSGKYAINPQIAWIVTDILSDDAARTPTYGPNSFLKLSRPAAAKTGTTDDSRDGWTIGFTPELVTGVWVGNADNSPMWNVFGVSGAGYIWHNAMEELLKDKPATSFNRPPGLVIATVYAPVAQPVYTTTVGNEQVANRYMRISDWFLEGTVPRLPYMEPTPTPANSQMGTRWPVPTSATPTTTMTPTTTTPTVTTTRNSPFLPLFISISAVPTPTPGTVTPTPGRTSTPVRGLGTRTPIPSPSSPLPLATPEPSSGMVTVPSVVGLAEDQARTRIEASGLNNTYSNYQGEGDVPSQVMQSVSPGHVLSQNPQPGARVLRGTTVYLAVRKK